MPQTRLSSSFNLSISAETTLSVGESILPSHVAPTWGCWSYSKANKFGTDCWYGDPIILRASTALARTSTTGSHSVRDSIGTTCIPRLTNRAQTNGGKTSHTLAGIRQPLCQTG